MNGESGDWGAESRVEKSCNSSTSSVTCTRSFVRSFVIIRFTFMTLVFEWLDIQYIVMSRTVKHRY